jgi:hypothetical protein
VKKERSLLKDNIFLKKLSSTYFQVTDLPKKPQKESWFRSLFSRAPKEKPAQMRLDSLPTSARGLIPSTMPLSNQVRGHSRESSDDSGKPELFARTDGSKKKTPPRPVVDLEKDRAATPEGKANKSFAVGPRKHLDSPDREKPHVEPNRTMTDRLHQRTKFEKPIPLERFLPGGVPPPTPKAPENDHRDKDNISVNHDKSTSNCLVCFDRGPDAVIMNCGHGGLCYECAMDIWEKTGECYLCRKVCPHS